MKKSKEGIAMGSENKGIVVSIVFLLALMPFVFAQAAAPSVNVNRPWHNLSQIARDSATQAKVDSNDNGIIDQSEASYVSWIWAGAYDTSDGYVYQAIDTENRARWFGFDINNLFIPTAVNYSDVAGDLDCQLPNGDCVSGNEITDGSITNLDVQQGSVTVPLQNITKSSADPTSVDTNKNGVIDHADNASQVAGVPANQIINNGGIAGTPNTVAKFTAPNVIGNSAIVETGGAVGIGTATPGAGPTGTKFNIVGNNVAGNSFAFMRIETPQANQAGVIFTNQQAATQKDWVIGLDSGGGNTFRVAESTTLGTNTRLTIAPGGNVGIGVSSPGTKLDVNGPVRWGTARGLLNTDQGAAIELGGSGTPYIDFSNDMASDNDARIILNGDDLLSILGANVGIGVVSPTQPLDVAGITKTTDLIITNKVCPAGQKLTGSAGGNVICAPVDWSEITNRPTIPTTVNGRVRMADVGCQSAWGTSCDVDNSGYADSADSLVGIQKHGPYGGSTAGSYYHLGSWAGNGWGPDVLVERARYSDTSSYANSANSATYSTYATYLNTDAANAKFHWAGQPGQPNWVWGGSSDTDMYVWNPSNFNVAYAAVAGSAASCQRRINIYVCSGLSDQVGPIEIGATATKCTVSVWGYGQTVCIP